MFYHVFYHILLPRDKIKIYNNKCGLGPKHCLQHLKINERIFLKDTKGTINGYLVGREGLSFYFISVGIIWFGLPSIYYFHFPWQCSYGTLTAFFCILKILFKKMFRVKHGKSQGKTVERCLGNPLY